MFSIIFIKKQTFNNRLINTWNNFKYLENIVSKKIKNIKKFIFLIIALYINVK